MNNSEKLLVSRAALFGDKRAFGKLVESYQSPIRRFFLNITGADEELSKDLAQETFIKAWLNIGSFRAAARFSTWVYRIAYNTFLDSCRSRKITDDLQGENIRKISYDRIQDQDISIDMARSLLLLKEEERTAILLFYMEDLPIEKISMIMDIPPGTVKSHLSRGKKNLAEILDKSGYDYRKTENIDN